MSCTILVWNHANDPEIHAPIEVLEYVERTTEVRVEKRRSVLLMNWKVFSDEAGRQHFSMTWNQQWTHNRSLVFMEP